MAVPHIGRLKPGLEEFVLVLGAVLPQGEGLIG